MKIPGSFVKKRSLLIVVMSVIFTPYTWAQTASDVSNLQLSGFISVIGGKIFGGASNADYVGPTEIYGHSAPSIYVADWANAGIYSNNFSLEPESHIGVQANYKLTDAASITVQIVSRATNPTPDLQWAYGSYKFDKNWEIQAGRKRIPLYYYSDFQDIGISYPWVTPPPELYGWEVTNYNGASLRYNGNLGNTNLTASVFAGGETNNDSLYEKLYYPGKTRVKWNNIVGGDVEGNYGPLTVRGMYMQANENLLNLDAALDDNEKINAYGLAVNLDFSNWFVLSEITQLTREFIAKQYKVTAPAYTIGAGMRLGKWTPLINFAKYNEYSTDIQQYVPQPFRRSTLALRYDIDANSAAKIQFDRQTDVENNYGGNSNIFRVSYDRAF